MRKVFALASALLLAGVLSVSALADGGTETGSSPAPPASSAVVVTFANVALFVLSITK